MQRALIAGVGIAVTCSVVGLFLVLRRHSLFGDALAHMAFGGVAVGLTLNIYPLWTAMALSVAGSLGITKLRQSTKIPPDATVAILLSSGLAVGILLITLSKGFNVDLFSILFGSILLISVEDTLMALGLTGSVLAIIIVLYKKFVYITFDEEQAKVSGLEISRLNYLFIILASLTVVVSMRLVGILLISSLIVIPNITALMFGKGFKKTALISISFSVFSVITGIVVSYAFNLPPGGTIVLVSIVTFLATLGAKYSRIAENRKEKLAEIKS